MERVEQKTYSKWANIFWKSAHFIIIINGLMTSEFELFWRGWYLKKEFKLFEKENDFPLVFNSQQVNIVWANQKQYVDLNHWYQCMENIPNKLSSSHFCRHPISLLNFMAFFRTNAVAMKMFSIVLDDQDKHSYLHNRDLCLQHMKSHSNYIHKIGF